MKYVDKSYMNKFIYEWLCRYRNDYEKFSLMHYTDRKNRIVRITNIKTGKSAIAKCHKGDKFSESTGIAIAYAKYQHCEIPKVADTVEAVLDKYNVKDVDQLETILSDYFN